MRESEDYRKDRILAEWILVKESVQIAPGIFLQDLNIRDSYMHQTLRTLALEIEACVVGQRRPDKVVESKEVVFFEYPASPFQHWKFKHKSSWWLKWFTKKYPVIIAEKAKKCTLSVSWAMTDVYPEQTRVHPTLGEQYTLIDPPRSIWRIEDQSDRFNHE
jgi:hypothetical protein